MSEELQELHRQVNASKLKRSALIKDIKRLKTESGMKLEAIIRNQEKKNALSMEAKERVNEHKKLEEGLRDKLELKKTSPTKQRGKLVQEEDDNLKEDSEEKEKLVEKFTSLLENKVIFPIQKNVKKYLNDAYGHDENEENAEDEKKLYSKSQIVSTIMVVLEDNGIASQGKGKDDRMDTITEDTPLSNEGSFAGEQQNYLTTFRVAGNTSITQFKEMACKFWNKKMDQYQFFDEKGDILEETKKDKDKERGLEKFFKHRKNDLTQLMIIMRPKQAVRADSVQLSVRSKKGRRESQFEQQQEENRYNAVDPFFNFGLLLPKLKPYIQVNKDQTDQREREYKKMNKPTTFGDSHICISAIVITMMILSIVSILGPRDLYREHYTIESINRLADAASFKKIATVDDLLDNMVNNIATTFFPATVPTGVTDSQTSLGLFKPLYLRHYKVEEKECSVKISRKCYEETYSTDTRVTSAYSDKYGDSFTFSFQEKGDFDGTIPGKFGSYNNDAYFNEYSPVDTDRLTFKTKMCKLFMHTTKSEEICTGAGVDVPAIKASASGSSEDTYLAANSKAIRITINMVDVSQKTFFIVEPLIEFTPAGTLLASFGKTIVFRPNTKENVDINEKAINVMQVLLATFLLLFVLYRLFTKENVTIDFTYFVTLPGTLNLVTIILTYACNAVTNSFNGLSMTEQITLNDSVKTAFNEVARRYEVLFILRSILAAVLIVRVCLLSKIHTRMQMVISGFENSIPKLTPLLVIIAPMVITLGLFGHISLGKDNMFFATIDGCTMVTSMLLVGFQMDILHQYNAAECILIIVGFCFCLFLLGSIVAAVHVENYRLNKLDYNDAYHTTYTWKFGDYRAWLFSWVPSGVTKTKEKLKGKLGAGGMKLREKVNMAKFKGIFKRKEKEAASPKIVGEQSEQANMMADPLSPA